MKKTRKNFCFNTKIVRDAEKVAKRDRKSLTKHLEDLMHDNNIDNNEFFTHMNKRHEKI